MSAPIPITGGTGSTPTGQPAGGYRDDEQVVLILDENGWIQGCNRAAAKLLGCPSTSLIWQHISKLLPELRETVLIQGGRVNSKLRYLTRVGHRFRLTSPDGNELNCRIFVNDLEGSGHHHLCLILQPARRSDD